MYSIVDGVAVYILHSIPLSMSQRRDTGRSNAAETNGDALYMPGIGPIYHHEHRLSGCYHVLTAVPFPIRLKELRVQRDERLHDAQHPVSKTHAPN